MRILLPLLLSVVPALAGCVGPLRAPQNVLEPPPVYEPVPVAIGADGLIAGGRPFVVKGVVYAPVGPDGKPVDFLDDPDRFRADLALFKVLGANTVRIEDTSADCASRRRFLDAADADDLKVVLGVDGPRGLEASESAVRREFRSDVRGLATCYARHPVVFAWSIGNGLD
ncbi:MAG: hypothetical protein ACT4PT_04485 [Methanobacteriota archaeon]